MAVQLQPAILGVVGLVSALLLPISPASGAPPATCDGKPATIVGTDQGDDLEGTDGDDVVSLGDGADLFHGHGGDDTICAGTGFGDSIMGGPGNDRLSGEGGRDFLYGGSGDDTLRGGRGHDYLYDEGFEECPPGEFCQEAEGDGADNLFGGVTTTSFSVRPGRATRVRSGARTRQTVVQGRTPSPTQPRRSGW